MWSIALPREVEKTLRERIGIPDGVSIEFAYEFEDDISPEDSLWDAEVIQWVTERIEAGNDAAWFRCRVSATDGDAVGEDYLGGCAYEEFADFLTPDDYFGDMVASAYDAFMADAARLSLKYAKAL